jgi:hypothetical protein
VLAPCARISYDAAFTTPVSSDLDWISTPTLLTPTSAPSDEPVAIPVPQHHVEAEAEAPAPAEATSTLEPVGDAADAEDAPSLDRLRDFMGQLLGTITSEVDSFMNDGSTETKAPVPAEEGAQAGGDKVGSINSRPRSGSALMKYGMFSSRISEVC